MARHEIVQGSVSDVIVKPTWGTIEKSDNEKSYEETYMSLALSLVRLLDNKIGNEDLSEFLKQYGLVYFNNMLYIDPNPEQSDYGS